MSPRFEHHPSRTIPTVERDGARLDSIARDRVRSSLAGGMRLVDLSRPEHASMPRMLKLHVIIASTRPGRIGLPIGNWTHERAKAHGKFDVTLVDLKEVNLPMMDEPKHPRLQQYEHAHTKAWSATIAAADAFVLVTPEYNFSTAPSLLNAFDFLYKEWNYKPAAFVSYGGISGGLRAVEMTKQTLSALKVMPLTEAVTLPFAMKLVTDGRLAATEDHEKSATAVLDELHRWATALKPMRS
jgi:NAD(P)H-dependent FMN reductase